MARKKKPQILVTGAAGALAKLVMERLKREYRLVAIDFRQKAALPSQYPSYCIDFHKRGLEDVFRTHQFDAVLHLGRIMAMESNRQYRYNANVLGTRNLLELCRKYQVPQVLILSTFFVYGAHAFNPALLDENAPLKASELTLNLLDSVELENLAHIYLWKHPQLNITILRPARIVGPGVRNSTSLLLSRKIAPVLIGFSPVMQYLHVADMAHAVVLALKQNKSGIYNVAPEDWIAYQEALRQCGCKLLPLPSIPPLVPHTLSKMLAWKAFPSYLINYFKYPVVIDGSLFKTMFGFKTQKNLEDIFRHYRDRKKQRHS